MTAEGLSDMEACALAANLRAAVATTSEACFFEAAIHAILSGDITSFTQHMTSFDRFVYHFIHNMIEKFVV